MMPSLYQKDGTTKIGNLSNCIECLVEEERNGLFEVTLQYPNTENIATSLVYDNIIVCDANDTLKNQKFRIYDTRRMMNNTIQVYARHISFDLAYDYVNSIDITNQSCEYALNTIFRQSQFCTGYVGHSDIVNAQNYKISNCNALEAIAGKRGSIIDTYGTGAEILRDNIDIYVYNKRGNDNEVSIEYAKNLTGFELQENTDDLITRIIPFATYTPEGGTQTRVDGPTCNSQYITNYSHPFIAEIDFSDKFEDNEEPTASKLQTLAEKYFNDNKCDLPKQNWKIEFIPLSKCVGYEGIEDKISLCDTVTIIDTRYNINTKAKVIKTVYDVLRERYDSMELGEPRTTLGDIVNTGSEKGEQGPPGPQGPKGEDGNIGDFPDSLPSKPTLNAKLLGFASIQLDWTYENKPYYWYEVYANKEKDFTPNVFDIVHKGQTSSFLYQAKPGETWYFRVCGINSYDHRGEMSDQVEVVTTLVDNLENYFTTAAIGQAVVGSLTADYMETLILKGEWIDAKNLSVTDGNGKRTLDIDSFGNVNLDVNSISIRSKDVATEESIKYNLTDSSIQYYLSNSLTSLTGGSWQDTAPEWTQGKYMWQRMKYTKYDSSVTYGEPVCIAGSKGDTGDNGVGISSIKEYYQVSDSNSTAPTSWSNIMPNMTPLKKYLWNFSTITYTDGTTKDSSKRIIGVYGDTGEKGQSLTSSTPQWYLSTSNTSQTGGSWVETMPTITDGKYMWTRFKNVWANPSETTYTTPVLEQISETVKKVQVKQSSFESDLDGFKTTVSSTYTTKTDFENLETRTSQIEQDVDAVTYSFSHSYSNPNLLRNGKINFHNYDLWTLTNVYLLDNTAYPNKLNFYNSSSTNIGEIMSPSVECSGSTKYSISFKYYRQKNVGDTSVILRQYNSNGGYTNTTIDTITTVASSEQIYNKTITTKSTSVRFNIIIKTGPKISSTYDAMGAGEFMVIKGDGLYPLDWYPAQQEIMSDITTIDGNGVTVKHSTGDFSRMNGDGFVRYIKNTGHTYRSMITAGSVILSGSYQESFTITLPEEFDNIPERDLKLWWSMECPKYSYGTGGSAPPVLLSEIYMPDGLYTDWTKNSSGHWTVTSNAHYKVYEYSKYIDFGTHNTKCIGFVINYYVSA